MNTCRDLSRRSILATLLAPATFGAARAQSISLPFEPVPGNAPLLAERAVSVAFKVEGIALDYSHESLKHIDRTVLGFRSGGISRDSVGSTLFVFGCYVGEVVVRQLGARWEMPGEAERKVGFDWMGLRSRKGAFWDPINKVFKLLRNGEEDSVWYLYSVIKAE